MKISHTEAALNLLHQVKAIYILCPLGWKHQQGMLFEKQGKVYDLSSADLELIPKIEKEGLYLVNT